MTYADLGGLGPLSAQVVLVGDPGQIAPVVTGDSRRWRDVPAGPQRAAPEALVAAYPEAVTRLQLSSSWRLGPQTTALIQPAFYADLPFTSARPPRHIQLDGAVLPELSVQSVTPLAGPGDSTITATAATRVRELLSGGLVVDGGIQVETVHIGRRGYVRPSHQRVGEALLPGSGLGISDRLFPVRVRASLQAWQVNLSRRRPVSHVLRVEREAVSTQDRLQGRCWHEAIGLNFDEPFFAVAQMFPSWGLARAYIAR